MIYCPYLSPDFQLMPAGLGRRLIALVIDLVLIAFTGFVFALLISPLLLTAPSSMNAPLSLVVRTVGPVLVYLTLGWLYSAGFESSEGMATIGKTMVGIHVTDLAGDPISFGRASLRYLGKLLSILTLGVGFFIMARHPRRMTLHDRLTRTMVIINLDSPIVGPG